MQQKKILKNIIGFAIALVLLVASGVIGSLTGIFEGLSDITGTLHFNVTTLLKAAIILLFLFTIHFLLQFFFQLFSGKSGRAGTMVTVFASLTKYILFIVGFCWLLSIIGVNISTIFASLGIVALIIGFGAESLIADVVTGVFVLFENQFNLGDIIEVGGFRGTVHSIGIRTTALKDAGGNLKIINNSELKDVINRSNIASVAISEVGISYQTDLEQFEAELPKILEGIRAKHEDVFIGTVEYLGVEALADSAVVVKFKAEVNEADIFSGRRLLNRELKVAFDKAGFEIAYPQLDIHTR